MIEAGQALIDRVRVQILFAGAHRRKQIFGRMGSARHGRKIHDPCRALQGMKGPERAVQNRAVVRFVFERQQIGRCLFDQFARFDQELFEKFVHAGEPAGIDAHNRVT